MYTDFLLFIAGSVSFEAISPASNLTAIPLGAPIRLQFSFSSSQNGELFFLPLYHTPFQQPVIDESRETRAVNVAYTSASPSLTGEYILCKAGFFRSRRRRNVAGAQYDFVDCSDRITFSIVSKLSLFTYL